MKVLTVLGTRPEIIRLSRVIALLDDVVQHILVDTGQNYDPNLSEIFYSQMKVRRPDHQLECRSDSAMGQISLILQKCDAIMASEKPDKVLILGDTNSGIVAFAAKRRGIPVYHMEAGNRCYDERVPEEVNRRVIDHSSDVLMPYTERSRQNLLREGFAGQRVFVTGNPIGEVLKHYAPQIEGSSALTDLNLETEKYFLATLHRSENVDRPERLKQFLDSFARLSLKFEMPLILSLHPRTRSKLPEAVSEYAKRGIRMVDPMGFFDFVRLQKSAFCNLSDSGTVQEESAIFGVPSVTIRDVTERPETQEYGSNLLSGPDFTAMEKAIAIARRFGRPETPPEYLRHDVSKIVAQILLSPLPPK
jgi:UDP-N-acetylglucosamine 2-epimerase (non-hydrolysing)